MSKHTPGPWAVADLPHSIVVRTESPKKSKFGANRYAAIGGFDRADPDQLAEAMANARLIAAAPELLAALDNLARYADTCELFLKETHPGKAAALGGRVSKAIAAIAKANGDTTSSV
jgi:hypothetical protein